MACRVKESPVFGISVMSGEPAVPTKRRRGPRIATGLFERNELKGFVLKAIREGGALTVKALTDSIFRDKEIDAENEEVRRAVERRILAQLYALTKRSILTGGDADAAGCRATGVTAPAAARL